MISWKDAAKLFGLSIIACCAVFVCTLFLNYGIDLNRIQPLILSPQVMAFYDAQVSITKVISIVSGGCLLATSAVMLFFYIRHYIDVHRKELGIQKALGYFNRQIAIRFWIFGLSVFMGTALGYASSFLLMPTFYKLMNEDNILPHVTMHFNGVLVLYLVVLPTLFFALLAIGYSLLKLKCPVLNLLRGTASLGRRGEKAPTARQKQKQEKLLNAEKQRTFLEELKKGTVKSRPSLIFFMAFSSFCFSSMMQMCLIMDDFASEVFTAIIFVIGLILSSTTLFLALTTIVRSNTKTISMMRVFGYSHQECSHAILNGYRPIALAGFVVGTIYQYFLMELTLSLYADSAVQLPEHTFNWPGFFIVLFSFVVIYQAIMVGYSSRIRKLSIKEIMLE